VNTSAAIIIAAAAVNAKNALARAYAWEFAADTAAFARIQTAVVAWTFAGVQAAVVAGAFAGVQAAVVAGAYAGVLAAVA